MNVNKKFDRLRQWGKEKMGGDGMKTDTTDNFKALEAEMTLRHEGLQRLHTSMNSYSRSLSKRSEGEDKEKYTPVSYLGYAMVKHGEDFEDSSKFGQCLTSFGHAHEKIGRTQETYSVNASSSWLDSLERSLAQMKDYHNARKRLENRRLAYDTSLAKMHKAKKEDFKTEEELRSQRAKYEESAEDVHHRMQDIIDAEVDTIADLHMFLEAELTYHDRCRDILLQLKQNWPVRNENQSSGGRRGPRSRASTLNSMISPIEETDYAPPEPPFRAGSRVSTRSNSPYHDTSSAELAPPSPTSSRFISSRAQTTSATQPPMPDRPSLHRNATDSSILSARLQFRPTKRAQNGEDIFLDPTEDRSNSLEKFDRSVSNNARSTSPSTSYGAQMSRSASQNGYEQTQPQTDVRPVKGPPPPPPSRSTKPPPPPPPMKRSALSTASVASY